MNSEGGKIIFGVSMNEPEPGRYTSRCTEVNLKGNFKGVPKYIFTFEITEGNQAGKSARMYFNNPVKENSKGVGFNSKIYITVNKLYPELFINGKAKINLKELFEGNYYEIEIGRRKKKDGNGYTVAIDNISVVDLGF